MKTIKKLEWLDILDTSLPHMTYLHLHYNKCNWCVDGRESRVFRFLKKRDKNKQDRVLSVFLMEKCKNENK